MSPLASPHADADTDVATDVSVLLRFNIDLLEQAVGIAAVFDGARAGAWRAAVGPHVRHVIEHYEALHRAAATGRVDYDRRPRDAAIESVPAIAVARLRRLQAELARWTAVELGADITVRLLGGVSGEHEFTVRSSLGRELMFVASHAVHHYALLVTHCRALDVPLPDGFGVAPATVAWRRAGAARAD
jgi:hypothetical protein